MKVQPFSATVAMLMVAASYASASPPKDVAPTAPAMLEQNQRSRKPLSASRSEKARAQPPSTSAPFSACRAPIEAGCNRCCERRSGGCNIRTWQPESWPKGPVGYIEPFYNVLKFSDEACPTGCPPCAKCLKAWEREIQLLGDRLECDCTKPTGVDPCMHFGSCECYCSKMLGLSKSCPHLAPPRFRAKQRGGARTPKP